jgi:hypothetical protein
MNYVYYKCDWVIQPLKPSARRVLLQLYDDAIEHDCLFLFGAELLRTREDGIHILQFLWRAPSFEGLEASWGNLKPYIQFTSCEPIPEQDFEGYGDPHAFARMRVGSDFNVYFDRMGEENEAILNQQNLTS